MSCIALTPVFTAICASGNTERYASNSFAFSIKEAETAKDSGAVMIGLGKRILRTETASGFALACLVYALEMKE
mgnify:CR=1 FL=1